MREIASDATCIKFDLFICALALPLSSLAQTFIIGESATTGTNPEGFSAGDSISFQGSINVPTANAVDLDLTLIPAAISLTFQAGSTSFSGTEDGGALSATFEF